MFHINSSVVFASFSNWLQFCSLNDLLFRPKQITNRWWQQYASWFSLVLHGLAAWALF